MIPVAEGVDPGREHRSRAPEEPEQTLLVPFAFEEISLYHFSPRVRAPKAVPKLGSHPTTENLDFEANIEHGPRREKKKKLR